MSKGGGSQQPAGQTTTTTQSGPWSGQVPYLQAGLNQAQNLFNMGGPQYYPGQTYAGPTETLLQGIQNEANLGTYGTQAQQAADPALQNILGGTSWNANPTNQFYQNAAGGGMGVNTQGYYQPLASGQQQNMWGVPTLDYFASGATANANNPYFQQMAATTAANVLPAIQSQFNSGNRLDSGLSSYGAGQGLGNAIGNLAYQNYQQGLGQQQQAAQALSGIGQENIQNQLAAAGALTNLGFGNLNTQFQGAQGLGQNWQSNIASTLQGLGLAPNIGNMDYQQAMALQEAGGNLQNLNQQAINDAVARWNFGQNQPYQNLQTYMSTVMGMPGGTGSSSTPYYNNSTANALSSGLGAYAMGRNLFGGGGSDQTSQGMGGGSGSSFFGNLGNIGTGIGNMLGSGGSNLFSFLGL